MLFKHIFLVQHVQSLTPFTEWTLLPLHTVQLTLKEMICWVAPIEMARKDFLQELFLFIAPVPLRQGGSYTQVNRCFLCSHILHPEPISRDVAVLQNPHSKSSNNLNFSINYLENNLSAS